MLTFTRRNLSVALAALVVGPSLTWRAGLGTDAPPPGPDVPTAILDWGDDYNHFIVDATSRTEPAGSNVPLAAAHGPAPLAPVVDQGAASPGVEQAVEARGLVLSAPRTDSERAAAAALPTGQSARVSQRQRGEQHGCEFCRDRGNRSFGHLSLTRFGGHLP